MKRQAVGHIEMILAFIIFVGALFGGLYFFSPANSDRLIDSTLYYAMREIKDNTESTFEKFSIVIKDKDGCKDANKNFIELNLGFDDAEDRLSVINNKGERLEVVVFDKCVTTGTDGCVIVKHLKQSSIFDLFIFEKDYMTPEYFELYNGNKGNNYNNNYLISYSGELNSCYTVSNTVKKTTIIEQKVIYLQAKYAADYANLKEELNLPGRADFGFELDFGADATEPKKITAMKEVPNGLEVFADMERVEVLRTDGSIVYADLIVRVW